MKMKHPVLWVKENSSKRELYRNEYLSGEKWDILNELSIELSHYFISALIFIVSQLFSSMDSLCNISHTKNCFFGKISMILKSLAKLAKREHQTNMTRDKKNILEWIPLKPNSQSGDFENLYKINWKSRRNE